MAPELRPSLTWIDDLPPPDPQVLLDDGVVPQEPAVPEHHDLLGSRGLGHHCVRGGEAPRSVDCGRHLGRGLVIVAYFIQFSFDELLLLLFVGGIAIALFPTQGCFQFSTLPEYYTCRQLVAVLCSQHTHSICKAAEQTILLPTVLCERHPLMMSTKLLEF